MLESKWPNWYEWNCTISPSHKCNYYIRPRGGSSSLPTDVYDEESSSTGWSACLFSSVFSISTSLSVSFSFLSSVSLVFCSLRLSWKTRRPGWRDVARCISQYNVAEKCEHDGDTHCFQRFVWRFVFLWLFSRLHNWSSVFPLSAVSLLPLGHRAGTRGEGRGGWD